jgi:hypothetical protein
MESRGRAALTAFLIVSLGAAAVLATIGGAVSSRSNSSDGSAHAWFVWAIACVVAAVMVALFYFALHPLVLWLDDGRTSRVAKRTESLVQNQRRLRAAKQELAQLTDSASAAAAGSLAPVAAKPAVGSDDITVQKAMYGAANVAWKDVTQVVASLLTAARARGEQLSLFVRNETFGGDPAPGVVKILRVDYELRGRMTNAEFQEGTTAVLPPQ